MNTDVRSCKVYLLCRGEWGRFISRPYAPRVFTLAQISCLLTSGLRVDRWEGLAPPHLDFILEKARKYFNSNRNHLR